MIKQLRDDNVEPAFFTLYSYAAMQVLAQGIGEAGEPDPDAVIDVLHKGNFDTVIGPLKFDDKGDLTEPAFVMYSWNDGKYQPSPANREHQGDGDAAALLGRGETFKLRKASPMPNSLRNSTVVITGASSGIGKAAALAFAAQGANLVLGARRDEALFEVAEEAQRYGVHAIAVPSDVTDLEDMRLLASTAAQRFGGIDVWINNAGIGLVGPFADVPMESHRRVVETNLFGGMNGTHAVLPYFLDQQYGTLITNISFGAWIAPPFAAAYAASKAGLEAFTQSIRLELEDWPEIHVCDVFPAVIDTPGYQHGGNYMGKEIKPSSPLVPPERVADAMVSLAKRPRRGVTVGAMAPVTKFMHTLAPAMTEERDVPRAEALFPPRGPCPLHPRLPVRTGARGHRHQRRLPPAVQRKRPAPDAGRNGGNRQHRRRRSAGPALSGHQSRS